VSDEQLQQPGLDALRKERDRADAAEKRLKELEMKVGSADVLANELNQTKNTLASIQKQGEEVQQQLNQKLLEKEKALQQLKIEQTFNRSAIANKLNPVYADLLLKANQNDFIATDDGIKTTDGRTIDDWLSAKKSELPQLFLPPDINGTGMQQSQSNGAKKVSVSRDNSAEFLSNLDAIADGQIDTV
jgi:uncharacterized coiled-coil protein SlyX